MSPTKRLCDLLFALMAAAILALPAAVIAALILLGSGRPVFYISERMKTPSQSFGLWKFRTMTRDENDSGVSGGDKAGRITREGRILRRLRLDEIPQLWNILKGDMSFVGPRPPLPGYVAAFPEIYRQVLQSRPGLTGLATLCFRRHEERILAACQSPEETEAAYIRRCIPRKAALDLIWQRKRSLCFDLYLIFATMRGLFKQRR